MPPPPPLVLSFPVGAGFSADWRSWYSWKHGTMHRFVWHSGQWYLVLRRRIRPWASIVFQQKLQPSAGPSRTTGQWLERWLSRPGISVEREVI